MYLGRSPTIGTQRLLDSIESQFNGTLTTFDLRYGGTPTYPTLSAGLLVSLGGVLQEPSEAYYVSSDKIVFSAAPQAGTECWILLYSQYGTGVGAAQQGLLGAETLTLTGELRGPSTFVIDPAAVGDDTGLVRIKGNLEVLGATTNINSTTLVIEDKNIILGDTASPTDALADGGGITLKGSTDKTISWLDGTDAWTLSEHVSIASAKEYRIAGTKVLDATGLGSGVLGSSLTSVGTIASGTWQGGAIADTYLGTIATAGKVSNSATTATSALGANTIVARDGSNNFTAGTITAALTGAASSNVLKAGDTMTGALVTTAGTVTANGIQVGTGTTYKPGIYSPGADQLAISTNGMGRLYINSAGQIGIGTPNQNQPLQIYSGSGDSTIRLQTNSGTEENGYIALRNSGGNLDLYSVNGAITLNPGNTERARIRSDGMFEVKGAGTAGSSPAFSVNGSAPANSFVIDSSGRLGIGTSSPVGTLHLKHATDANIFFRNGPSAGLSTGTILECFNDAINATTPLYARASQFQFGTDSAGNFVPRMTVTSAGLVGIGTTSPGGLIDAQQSSSGENVAFRFRNTANTPNSTTTIDLSEDGLGRSVWRYSPNTGDTFFGSVDAGNYNLRLYTNANERARIRADGMFEVKGAGVAGTSPALSVSGSAPANSLVLDSSGRVGIGNPSPDYKLDVKDGTIRVKMGALAGAELGGHPSQETGFVKWAADNHHGIWFRGSVNSGGETVTGGDVTTFREYGEFQFWTGGPNMGQRMRITSTGIDVRGSIVAAGRGLNVPHVIVKSANGGIKYFEYYFDAVKPTGGGVAATVNIISVDNLLSFHQAAFTVEYGTRLQGISDATTSVCLKQFGVNRFNGGNVAITDTNDIAPDANSNSHANVTCVTNGSSGYIIQVDFSASVHISSFCSGVIRGWGVTDPIPNITFTAGA